MRSTRTIGTRSSGIETISTGARAHWCRWAVLLPCAVFGVFTYDVVASAPFSPPDFASATSVLRRIADLFEPTPTSGPPLPIVGRASKGARLNVETLEALNGELLAQSLNTTLPTAVGRMAGSYSVSNTGTATYTIPIWTPPGVRGIEPHLALTYMSGAADSLLGPGWSLSGLSSISRCTRTWAQDGAPGPVTLAMSDKFCLDGNRLRSTGGTYGAPNSTYQTEIETFAKVTAQGVAGNGPLWFEVRGKDGLSYEYGRSNDSRVLATGSTTPHLWALNRVSDRNGNNLVIAYLQTDGSFRPSSIQYAQGAGYHYEVVFGYINRPTGTNLNSYVGGNRVQQQMLLSTIGALSDGVLVRQYNLDYTTSPETRRGRLSAVQECSRIDCLRPTTITYQNGQAGVGPAMSPAGTGATSGRVNTVDLNGDGRMDLVYSTASASIHTWWVKFATSTGFGAALNAGLATNSTDPVLLDDFDANGSIDLLAPSGGVWFVLRWTGSAFTWISTGQLVDPGRPANSNWDFVPADVNGDGLPDLVSYRTDFKFYVRLNTSAGGTVSFSPTATVAYALSGRPVTGLWGNNSIPRSSVRYTDFNGDGRGDVTAKFIVPGYPIQTFVVELFSQGTTFTVGDGAIAGGELPLPVAWNDDECTDLMFGGFVRVAGCMTSYAATLPLSGGVLAMDWDADGRTDVLTSSGGILYVHRSTGDGIAAAAYTGIASGNGSWTVFDQNGDGLGDLASVAAGSAVTYGLHNGANAMPDLVTSITDGFGLDATFVYSSMSAWSSCYGRDSAPPAFPSRAFIGSIYVVCRLTASNGIGGTYQVSHSYYNSNLNLEGRGWLGFERHYLIDSRDGIVNMESYGQTFPHIGMAQYVLARQSDWTTKIREIRHTFGKLSLGSGFDSRSFPFVSQSVEDSFEVGGALNGQLITRATTTTAVDTFGSPTTVTVSIVDKSTSSPWYGETYTTRTNHTITNDTFNWCLGLPTQTSVTSTLPDGSSQTRTVAMTVDYAYCRSTEEVIEPANATLKATTTYGFDACGNVNSVSVVGKNPDGIDMPRRTTTRSYGLRCQFPESVTNALNQTSQRTFRYDLGVMSSETDANGLTTTWLYDGYGRKTQERRPDGTSTAWSFWLCDSSNNYCGVPDLRWGFTQTELDVAASTITQKFVFHDGLNRARYDERLNLAGGLTYLTVGYDALGRKSIEYVPVSTGGWHYHSYSYDLLNRPTADSLYAAGGILDRQARIAFEGRKTAVTDPKGSVTARYADVRGNLRRVVDPAPGGTTEYTWDHFGNLLSATDPIGALSSATYDVRGFKRASFDVDAGSWSYSPNSLGELVSQIDANGRTTSITYDLTGRVTSRAELEGTSYWTWGSSAGAKNIGRLQSMSGPGYKEDYVYDSLGRPAAITYTADSSYQVNFGYQASTGFLDNITYPVSTAGYRLRAQYVYSNGILSQVRDFNAPSTVWWRLVAEDARGNPIDEQFGNGVHALSNFDELTGHLNWWTSGNNAQYNNHQNLTFAWDKSENLERRIDVNQNNLTERFTYDALDRLTGSTLNSATDLVLGLNAAGNITSKVGIGTDPNSDIGTYTYHPVKRHAVASTSNGWTFTYDANGNMLTGRGSTVTWYSYNLPKTVTNGALASQFSYTPDRRYWRQDATYATGSENTIYIGSLLEKVTSASGTQYRHMIRAGSATVVVSRHSGGTNNTYYATQDSLGSTAVITNASGAVVVSENFGAFGNRRGSNWQGTPSAQDWTNIAGTTRRGFTGHTMVDNLTLIHMNGRMYDPLLGRFLSPDPFVQSLAASQALNPYSYCWNNPLRYVDPTGFSIFSKLWKGIKGFFKSVLRSLNLMVAAALTVVGFVTNNPALFKIAAALIKFPVHVTKGSDGLGLSFIWGFGAGTGSAGSGAGPPLTTPGINPTPAIPGLMSMQGIVSRAAWLDLRTKSLPNWLVDFLAGVGDVALGLATLGLLDGAEIRSYNQIGNVDTSSLAYNSGFTVGFIASFGIAALLVGRATPRGPASSQPPNRGFVGTPTSTTLSPGTLIDRYGSELGRFASPRGTPFEARSLAPEAATVPLRTYEVVKPLPTRSGPTAPWHGQPGGGTQFEFAQSIEDLVRQGFLRRVE